MQALQRLATDMVQATQVRNAAIDNDISNVRQDINHLQSVMVKQSDFRADNIPGMEEMMLKLMAAAKST